MRTRALFLLSGLAALWTVTACGDPARNRLLQGEGERASLEPPRTDAGTISPGDASTAPTPVEQRDAGGAPSTPVLDAAPAAVPVEVSLADLAPTAAANGFGPHELNTSNGEDNAADGVTITLNGQTYAKGLGVHAASELVYALGGQYTRFTADVGVDDEVLAAGSIVFQVIVDGTVAFDSGTMTGDTATKTLSVSLVGATELKLVVADAGDGNGSDHGDWAAARLIK